MTAHASTSGPLPTLPKPRLRGVVHQWACPVSAMAGAILPLIAHGAAARAAAAVYALALTGTLGVSALYHRGSWSESRRRFLRRLDHAMIFVLIAGTYTPFAVVALPGGVGLPLLGIVWAGALLGAALELVWIEGPRWKSAVAYVALGWTALWFSPELVRGTSVAVVALIAAGGVLYTAGALIYARRRPDPRPAVFGYHEIFHAFVTLAAALQFAAVVLMLVAGG